MPDYHPIFDDCKAKSHEYYSSLVVVSNGWRMATNGRIAVRETCTGPNTSAMWFPDLAPAFSGDFNKTATPIPTVSYEEFETCEQCQGKATKCWRCKGTGKTKAENKATELHNGYTLADEYLALLNKHGCKLYLPAPPGKRANGKAAKFTVGDTIEGRVMPMKPE